jgi:hypothetical protein
MNKQLTAKLYFCSHNLIFLTVFEGQECILSLAHH